MNLEPVTLAGIHVRLEPLSIAHADGLVAAAAEWGIDRARTVAGIEAALRDRDAGTAIPFATVQADTGVVVGATRLRDIVPAHRRLEIGSTWIGAPWRRTGINTEAKLLMLGHAFDALGCRRVELRADAENARSRRAIERIGAREEGTLRAFLVGPEGETRDLVLYSIVAAEWPGVRERLRGLLAR